LPQNSPRPNKRKSDPAIEDQSREDAHRTLPESIFRNPGLPRAFRERLLAAQQRLSASRAASSRLKAASNERWMGTVGDAVV
jgi:hypothetical protein